MLIRYREQARSHRVLRCFRRCVSGLEAEDVAGHGFCDRNELSGLMDAVAVSVGRGEPLPASVLRANI